MTDTPQVGDIVKDTATNRVGKVMGFMGPYVQLRPLGGGTEWDARPERLVPTSPAEALSAGVAEANSRSRYGVSVAADSVLAKAIKKPGTAKEAPPPSAECTLAERPGYEDLHSECRQTQDVFLPRSAGILLTPRCGRDCHTITDCR
ncbi:hypothetical protein ACFWP5_01755 [Streptomyces sp. NPDC058469]|uniref:hypothetical protein n=1 Tax=Streptomyces sp. NPDC058469 TaxID=3346514 RepID=UPI003668FCA6